MSSRAWKWSICLSVLLWGAIVGASSAFACTYTVATGSSTGYVFGYAGDTAGFCAGVVPGIEADGWTVTACSVAAGVPSMAYNKDGAFFAFTVTPSGEGCSSEEPPPDDGSWVELDWLQGLFGCVLFFSLVHGFTVGRSSS